MTAVRTALVVGSGIAGLAASTLLAQGGVDVEVVEIAESVGSLGSGITLQGNALRVLCDIGVWDEVRARGYGFDQTRLRTPGGDLIFEMTDARTGGPDLPATFGMYRPDLSAVLAGAAARAGVDVRLATTVTALESDGRGVAVTTSDGVTTRYDLVVGADGLRSTVRDLIGITTGPVRTGMGIWRLHAHRPASMVCTDLSYGGSCYIAGYCPTGEDTCYAYLVEASRTRDEMPTTDDYPAVMTALAESYHGLWDDLRAQMDDPERINYTHFESHVVDEPWHRGRVVLAGDAAHSCPPTLAQGAAMGLEDASVLAETLLGEKDVAVALDEYSKRRIPRARTVVEASVQLGQWMIDHTPDADVPGLMGRISQLVSQPA
jgi:2-polyprenyl-6-methoxyphenol hydroxylase-like FAD-dependent oxidoreductase